VHAVVSPYSVEAVKTSDSFSDTVNTIAQLNDSKSRLKHFFIKESRVAPCIAASTIHQLFWQSIDNHNRSTGLKNWVVEKHYQQNNF